MTCISISKGAPCAPHGDTGGEAENDDVSNSSLTENDNNYPLRSAARAELTVITECGFELSPPAARSLVQKADQQALPDRSLFTTAGGTA